MQFVQPDTLTPEPYNPQSYNRYSYTQNNPIRYTDPTGHWIETAWDIANIVWDIAEVRKDPSAINIGALILDVAAAILPVVPAGAGLLARGAKLAAKADDLADLGKAADKTYTVYRAVKNGVTEYVGITTDFFRRRDEHNLIGRGIEPIMAKLSKYDARAVEQVLIENFGRIEKEIGGTLSNINNSISKRKQYYEEALGRGVELLDEIVPEWSLWK
ncbi:MAG: hypothetical protein IT315_10070 [Anaerolineales bacterium]|nr:hypothetical protein [Anaerolineales bacterium]